LFSGLLGEEGHYKGEDRCESCHGANGAQRVDPQLIAHDTVHFPDFDRQLVNSVFHPVEPIVHPVEPIVDPVEPGLKTRNIIAGDHLVRSMLWQMRHQRVRVLFSKDILKNRIQGVPRWLHR